MAGQLTASKAPEPPTPRRAVRLLTGQPDTLDDADRQFVAALLERSSAIATAVDLVSRFVTMVKDQVADPFEGWLREAEASALTPVRRRPPAR
jgi:hypothetical protein